MGYVCALTHPMMPGLVKIGVTSRSVSERASEIGREARMVKPFVVEGYVYAFDAFAAERRLKLVLSNCRYSVGALTEFYRVPVRAALRLLVVHSFAGRELYDHWRWEQRHGVGRELKLGEISKAAYVGDEIHLT